MVVRSLVLEEQAMGEISALAMEIRAEKVAAEMVSKAAAAEVSEHGTKVAVECAFHRRSLPYRIQQVSNRIRDSRCWRSCEKSSSILPLIAARQHRRRSCSGRLDSSRTQGSASASWPRGASRAIRGTLSRCRPTRKGCNVEVDPYLLHRAPDTWRFRSVIFRRYWCSSPQSSIDCPYLHSCSRMGMPCLQFSRPKSGACETRHNHEKRARH